MDAFSPFLAKYVRKGVSLYTDGRVVFDGRARTQILELSSSNSMLSSIV